MKVNKKDLIVAAQDFVNTYEGKQGEEDYSYYDKCNKFTFGIDEGYYGTKDNTMHLNIQGTDENLEWRGDKKSNFNFIKKAFTKLGNEHYGSNSKIKVHGGFFEAYNTGRDMFLKYAEKYDYIFIKVHSRGGGIGTIAARDIQYHIKHVWKTKQQVILITGGSPRVYNCYGAKEFDDSGIICYRMVYRNDIVCNFPFITMGFRHVGKVIKLGTPYIPIPIGIPFDHYPVKYLKGIKRYRGRI